MVSVLKNFVIGLFIVGVTYGLFRLFTIDNYTILQYSMVAFAAASILSFIALVIWAIGTLFKYIFTGET